ncbi:uncharacterized protein Z518_07188 [Rhinocladiella mackenziei CBS 650.93]|uniref:Rhinocladiella mackenziei CBS 650.93 unplaced genomic scaffold supercont1.5, whole genome shotgun sequence n=1 Tax=Rhinocladiella mackenziei CBS 650.93 TaxID=1442369 RepID=A0A0D2J3S0_9EURO|nr:uncharacterized protein Z518_07188 [Rhinocladiella mackenziei CBS 650.93]KIX03635.1 hypothetical protein Z518_07188 [Rhinocladiella mackenziei CBS 650.93]
MDFRKILGRKSKSKGQAEPSLAHCSSGASSRTESVTTLVEPYPPREKYGLFILHEPPAGETQVDIVAVHGLGGDWEGTWTDDTTHQMWLRDFIPNQWGEARVLSFGYDSTFAFSHSVADIDDSAVDLINRLDGERQVQSAKKRPIIFVAHSLGGVVVKRALMLANERSDHWGNLRDQARCAIFFAVPHRGSDLAFWANLATRALSFASLGTHGNTNFVNALKRNSSEFAKISMGFIQPAGKLSSIRTFYETVKITNQLVVDKDSASLGLTNELAVPISGADHRNICKFDRQDSQKYRPVANALAAMSELLATLEPSSIREHAAHLARKANQAWESRVSSVPTINDDLTWPLHMPQYQMWYHDSSLDNFPRLLRFQYDCTSEWEANLAKVFQENLRKRREDAHESRPAHIITFVGPQTRSTYSGNLAVALPQSLIGQIFTRFPECIVETTNRHQETRKDFLDADWDIGELDKASRHCWRDLLDSHASNWRALWILLELAMRSLKEPIVVLLSSFDEEAYTCLRNGLEYLQSANMFESGSVNKRRCRWLVMGRPFCDVPGRFKERSIILSEAEEMEECRSALYFAELHARRDRVHTPASGTNLWIWEHKEYKRWLKQPSGLLWIYGKPGSGKSTLAKTILQAHDFRADGYLRADFFYSARGGPVETGHILMLRSILYQLLTQKEELFSYFQPKFRRLRGAEPGAIAWTFRDLASILLSFAEVRKANGPFHNPALKFFVVLDGFDESNPKVDIDHGPGNKGKEIERQRVLKLFHSLCSTKGSAIFRAVVLSRPDRDIRDLLRGTFAIDVKNENENDITRIVQLGLTTLWTHMKEEENEDRYVQPFSERDLAFDLDSDEESIEEGVNVRSSGAPEILETPQLDFARKYLLDKADGVILWVVMIIKELIKIAKSGVFTVAKLESMLSTIPTSVQELYEDILRRIKSRGTEDKRQSQYIVSWLLFTERTMRVDEFRDAFAMFSWTSSNRTRDFLDKNRVGSFASSWSPVRSLLENTCGGLVEIVPTERKSTQTPWERKGVSPEDQIQLIHQTAKDFLLANPDPVLFNVDYAESLRTIATTCVNYLIMTFPLERRCYFFSQTLIPERVYEIFVKYIQDRPLLIYTFEYLQSLFEDANWKEDERISTFAPLAHYLSQSKIARGSLWWLVQVLQSQAMPDDVGLQSAASRPENAWPSVQECRWDSTPSTKLASAQLEFQLLFDGIEPNHSSEYCSYDSEETEFQRLQLLSLRRKRYLCECLMAACRLGLLNAARTLVAAKAPFNGVNGLRPSIPLNEARQYQHYDIEKFLTSTGADSNLGPIGPREPEDLVWNVRSVDSPHWD